MSAVITDLGVLEPDPASCELVLRQVHPGVEVADVVAATGWPLQVAERGRAQPGADRGRADRPAGAADGGAVVSRAVILSAVRTPIGRYGGALSGVRPDDLAAIAVRRAVERPVSIRRRSRTSSSAARTRPARTTATSRGWRCCWRGCRVGAGRDMNRLCASGLAAVGVGLPRGRGRRRRPVRRGRRGVDEPGAAGQLQADKPSRAATARVRHHARLAVPEPAHGGDVPAREMGGTGENVAERWGVSRADQDVFALRSQRRWAEAQAAGRFADELAAVGEVTRDEHPRPDTSAERLAGSKPISARAGRSPPATRAASTTARPRCDRERGAGGALGAEPLGAFVAARSPAWIRG